MSERPTFSSVDKLIDQPINTFCFLYLNQVFTNFVSPATVNEETNMKYELYGYGKNPSWLVCPGICLEVMQNRKKIFGITTLQAEFPNMVLLNTSRI